MNWLYQTKYMGHRLLWLTFLVSVGVVMLISVVVNSWRFEILRPSLDPYLQEDLKPKPEAVSGDSTIQLTIRMPASQQQITYFLCHFLRSVMLYWSPKLGPIMLLLDDDRDSKRFANKVKLLRLGYDFRFAFLPKPGNTIQFAQAADRIGRSFGYMEQLYSSFLLDLYTNASVVAWTDADTMFVTTVTRSRIANNGRLIVKGMNTFDSFAWTAKWDLGTRVSLGLPMVSDFMTYFPVYLYPETVRNCRTLIMRRFRRSDFEEAFIDLIMQDEKVDISPVSIILSYAFYFERDRYEWHIDTGTTPLAQYNQRFLNPRYRVRHVDTRPDLHVTIHTSYFENCLSYFSRAMCTTGELVGWKKETDCKGFLEGRELYLYQFQTDPCLTHLDTWCVGNGRSACLELLDKHHAEVRSMLVSHPWLFNVTKLTEVETFAAQDFDVKCPRLSAVSPI